MSEKGMEAGKKKLGQHSRKHTTSEAHDVTRKNRSDHQKHKLDSAMLRQEVALTRTPQEQLARLDARGVVAKKEREKLAKKLVGN